MMNRLIAFMGWFFQPKIKKIFSNEESAVFYWKETDSYSLEYGGYTFFRDSEEEVFKALAEMEAKDRNN